MHARRLLRRQGVLAAAAPSCLLVAGFTGRSVRCNEPEEEPTPIPHFAPSAPLAPVASGRPPYNPDSSGGAVRNFLQSEEGSALIRSVVLGAVREALEKESRNIVADIQRARAKEEAGFRSSAKQAAKDAAQKAARKEVDRQRDLMEDMASAVVRKEAERTIPSAVRDDPLMKRLMQDSLKKVNAEVHTAAEKEIQAVCREDKYHLVNRAFLDALGERCRTSMREVEYQAQETAKENRQPQRITQSVAILALITASLAVFIPRSTF